MPTRHPALFEVPARRPRRDRRARDAELRPRPVRLPEHTLRTEYDLVAALDPGVYHLHDLYDAAEQAGVSARSSGHSRRASGGWIFEHRVRSALDSRRRWPGDTRSLGDCYWVIEGTRRRPEAAVLVLLGTVSDITLALGSAREVAGRMDEPCALIFVDPPWQEGVGLGRDGLPGQDQYRRDRSVLVPGYAEVPPGADYYEWTCEWLFPAAEVLSPGGHLAVVTGPRQSAAVQRAAEDAGLSFTNSIVVPKATGVSPAARRWATSHFRLTVMTAGPGGTFNLIPEMGTDQRGRLFPRDVWPPVVPQDSRGLYRYPNQLPASFADQVIRALSNEGDLVADFFCGSGTVPRMCLFRRRRCLASDVNEHALRFTMGTISSIVAGRLARPPLFGDGLFPELAEPHGR